MNEINQRVPKKMKYFSGLDDQINFATSTCQHPNQVNRPEQLLPKGERLFLWAAGWRRSRSS